MTTDEIMALADQYGMRAVKVSQGERPIDTSKYRAALRAAVEELVRENALLWANLSELQQTWADNKPAVAYKERTERAEAEATKLRGWIESEAQAAGNLQRKLNDAEAEIERLRALLREARGIVHAYLRGWPQSDAGELLARIDAALKEKQA